MVSRSLSPDPPVIFEVAGHPMRWRLLGELSGGDLRVGDLCARLGASQNLVSYHLGRLRSAGVVRRHRSEADGRDSYYALELARCGELLSEAGEALHPGLRLVPARLTDTEGPARGGDRRVLFACTGNSARSRIAEALLGELSGGRIHARSAGSHPKPLHPNAVRVLAERGIQLASTRSTHLDEVLDERFDYVITLCDRVREVCPEFPEHPRVLHWGIGDPARARSTDEETYPAFVATLAELEERIQFLICELDADREAQT